jgi:hypothetical protein
MTHDRTITEVEEMETARDCDRDKPQVSYWVELDRGQWATVMIALERYWQDIRDLAAAGPPSDVLLKLAGEHATATRLLRRLS